MKKEIRQINLHSINPDPTQPRKEFKKSLQNKRVAALC